MVQAMMLLFTGAFVGLIPLTFAVGLAVTILRRL